MTNQFEIDRKREKLKSELAELEEQERFLATLNPEMRLAEALHDLQCHQDHTEYCDWYYDSWPTTRGKHGSRTRFLEKAVKIRKLLPEFDDDQILKVAQALK